MKKFAAKGVFPGPVASRTPVLHLVTALDLALNEWPRTNRLKRMTVSSTSPQNQDWMGLNVHSNGRTDGRTEEFLG